MFAEFERPEFDELPLDTEEEELEEERNVPAEPLLTVPEPDDVLNDERPPRGEETLPPE